MAVHLLPSCFALPHKPRALGGVCSVHLPGKSVSLPFLSSSAHLQSGAFHPGNFWSRGISIGPRRMSVVCEAGSNKKPDSAAKRARQAEKRRVYNKARKSEIKTRMKKVFEALDELHKKADAQFDELLPVEKLIGEAYSTIDKAVKVGTLHRNTGAHRKSRLARRKKAVEIHHGWYTAVAAGEMATC